MTDAPTGGWNRGFGDCPAWCCGDHDLECHPDDAIHSTCVAPQPVVARYRPTANYFSAEDSTATFIEEATYFDVIRMQWACGGDEWVFVGDGTSSWMVTMESARRIYRAMAQILSL